jgi:hypothetical protein
MVRLREERVHCRVTSLGLGGAAGSGQNNLGVIYVLRVTLVINSGAEGRPRATATFLATFAIFSRV